MVFGALAGGLGWGIRGQYGHETGAMIAGVLVGLVMTFLFCGDWHFRPAARAAAWCAVAIGIGGSMTYAQTVGLTHDPALVGNAAAFRWGLLGLAVKGGLWIGFAGALLGMGLGGLRYRPLELTGVMASLLVLFFLGAHTLNAPFHPAEHVLPRLYFSADWRWQPGAALKPRREIWGGLLLALIGLVTYLAAVRRDTVAVRLAGWAVLGGVIGFPLGQCVQAFHAWHREAFQAGAWASWDKVINWWNFMETTFGGVMGGTIGIGAWTCRRRIRPPAEEGGPWPGPVEWSLLALHSVLLLTSEFTSVAVIGWYTEIGFLLVFLPIIAISEGRWWPAAILLPVTLLPIAGKTVRELVYQASAIPPWAGWTVYFAAPVGIATVVMVVGLRRAMGKGGCAADFLRPALLTTTWVYFGLNFAFFRYPWPFAAWTYRTPNALVFAVCAAGLTWLATARARRPIEWTNQRGD